MKTMNLDEMRAVSGGYTMWYSRCGKCKKVMSGSTKAGAYAQFCLHRLKHGSTPLYDLWKETW